MFKGKALVILTTALMACTAASYPAAAQYSGQRYGNNPYDGAQAQYDQRRQQYDESQAAQQQYYRGGAQPGAYAGDGMFWARQSGQMVMYSHASMLQNGAEVAPGIFIRPGGGDRLWDARTNSWGPTLRELGLPL